MQTVAKWLRLRNLCFWSRHPKLPRVWEPFLSTKEKTVQMVEVGSLLIAESVSGVRVTTTVVEALVVMVEDVLLAHVFQFVAAAAPAPVDEHIAPSLAVSYAAQAPVDAPEAVVTCSTSASSSAPTQAHAVAPEWVEHMRSSGREPLTERMRLRRVKTIPPDTEKWLRKFDMKTMATVLQL